MPSMMIAPAAGGARAAGVRFAQRTDVRDRARGGCAAPAARPAGGSRAPMREGRSGTFAPGLRSVRLF